MVVEQARQDVAYLTLLAAACGEDKKTKQWPRSGSKKTQKQAGKRVFVNLLDPPAAPQYRKRRLAMLLSIVG